MSNIAVLTEFGREQKKKGQLGHWKQIFFFFLPYVYIHTNKYMVNKNIKIGEATILAVFTKNF